MAPAHSKPTLTRSASLMTLKEYASVAGFIDVKKRVEDCRASIAVTAPSTESTTTDSSPSDLGSSTDNEEGQNIPNVRAIIQPMISDYLFKDRFLLEIKDRHDGTLYTSASIIKGNHVPGVPFEFKEKKYRFVDSGNEVGDIKDAIKITKSTTDEEEMNKFCLNGVEVHQSCPINKVKDAAIYVGGVHIGSMTLQHLIGGYHMGPMTETDDLHVTKNVSFGTTYFRNEKVVEFELCGQLTLRASVNVPDSVWTELRTPPLKYDLSKLEYDGLRKLEAITNQDRYSSKQWTLTFDTIELSEKHFRDVLDKFANLTVFQKEERSMQLRMHKLKYKIKMLIITMPLNTRVELQDDEESAMAAECYKFCRFLFVELVDNYDGVRESVYTILQLIVAIRLKLPLWHYQDYFGPECWKFEDDEHEYANLFELRVLCGRDENGSSPEQKHEKRLEEEFYETANSMLDNFASELKQSYDRVTQNGAVRDTTFSVEVQMQLHQERFPQFLNECESAFENFREQRAAIWHDKFEEEKAWLQWRKKLRPILAGDDFEFPNLNPIPNGRE